MKYLVAVVDGKESIFVFPRDINHNRMAEALAGIRFDTIGGGWNRKYRDGDVISAGFVDLGICHGRSETLKLNSRGPIDTELLRAFRAVEQEPQPTEAPAGRGVLPQTTITSVADLIQWHRGQVRHYTTMADMQSHTVGRPFFDAKVFLQGAEIHRAAVLLIEALDRAVADFSAHPTTTPVAVAETNLLSEVFPQGVGVMARVVGKVVVGRSGDGEFKADVHTYDPYDLEHLANGMVLFANGTVDNETPAGALGHPGNPPAWLRAEIEFEQRRCDEIAQAHDARANCEYHAEGTPHDGTLS